MKANFWHQKWERGDAVNEEEVKQHYGTSYYLKSVESKNVVGGLKGQVAATETVWLLQRADE